MRFPVFLFLLTALSACDKAAEPVVAPADSVVPSPSVTGPVNLAAGRPSVSGAEEVALGPMTDGDKETLVDLGRGIQWLEVDLGASCEIEAVQITGLTKGQPMVVQISDDPKCENGVSTVWNSDAGNAMGFGPAADAPYEGQVIDAKRALGRYVRLWSTASRYAEVEVWGLPRL